MLYHLFQYLDRSYDLPGAGMFQYISFRSALAVILALIITITFGQGIIRFMQRRQIGEEIRNLGLEGQLQKRGTPTMGGVMILLAVLVPVLLFGRLDNIYIQLMLVSTVWLGLLGFLDDYIKVFRHNKEGLKGKFKIVGQVGIGIIVGTVMCASPEVSGARQGGRTRPAALRGRRRRCDRERHDEPRGHGHRERQDHADDDPLRQEQRVRLCVVHGGNRVATWIL